MNSNHLIYGLSASDPKVTKVSNSKQTQWGFQWFEQMTNVWVVWNYNNNGLYRLYESDINNVIIEGEYIDVIKKLNEGFTPLSKILNK